MADDIATRVRRLLEALRMRHADEVLEDILPADPGQRVLVLGCLERLLEVEDARRIEQRIQRRLDDAHLPDRPTLETFDFEFQTGIDRDVVLDLATLSWVDRCEDLVLIGQSGVGKSHIAKALCLIGCRQQRRVLYTTCADMLASLFASLADGSLTEALKRYTRPQLLLVDDLGYDPIEQEHGRDAQLLYKVLSARHEKASTIITSNLPAAEWADYLGNHYLTVALLDRLLYHGTVLTIEGPSYRLAQHRRRQEERAATRQPADTDPADE